MSEEKLVTLKSLEDFSTLIDGKQICASCRSDLTDLEKTQLPFISEVRKELEQSLPKELKQLEHMKQLKQDQLHDLTRKIHALREEFGPLLHIQEQVERQKKELERLKDQTDYQAKIYNDYTDKLNPIHKLVESKKLQAGLQKSIKQLGDRNERLQAIEKERIYTLQRLDEKREKYLYSLFDSPYTHKPIDLTKKDFIMFDAQRDYGAFKDILIRALPILKESHVIAIYHIPPGPKVKCSTLDGECVGQHMHKDYYIQLICAKGFNRQYEKKRFSEIFCKYCLIKALVTYFAETIIKPFNMQKEID